MNANTGGNPGVGFGDLKIDLEIAFVGRKSDHAMNPGLPRARDDLRQFGRGESVGPEVAVGVGDWSIHRSGLENVWLVSFQVLAAHRAMLTGGIAVGPTRRAGKDLLADLAVRLAITGVNVGDFGQE